LIYRQSRSQLIYYYFIIQHIAIYCPNHKAIHIPHYYSGVIDAMIELRETICFQKVRNMGIYQLSSSISFTQDVTFMLAFKSSSDEIYFTEGSRANNHKLFQQQDEKLHNDNDMLARLQLCIN
jgi:hypothetical protein